MHPSDLVLYSWSVLRFTFSGNRYPKWREKSQVAAPTQGPLPTGLPLTREGDGVLCWRLIIQLFIFNCELWNRTSLWLQLLSTALKPTPRQTNEGGMRVCAQTHAHVYLLYLRGRKTGYWRFKRSSHQCLISFAGDGCLYLPVYRDHTGSSTWRGGLVGGDRGRVNPRPMDWRQSDGVLQALGARWLFFSLFFFSSQHAFPS